MADSKPIDLDKYRSIGSLRPGYKKAKRTYRLDGDKSGSTQTEHFDGRLDANIKVKTVKARSGTMGKNKE